MPSACSPCTTRALPPAVDVALLSASPTLGWRMADDAFAALVRDAGASCAVVRVSVGRAAVVQAPSGADGPGRGSGVAAQRVAAAAGAGGRRVDGHGVVLSAAFRAVRGAVRRARRAEPAGLAGGVAAVDRAARAGAGLDVLLPWSEEAAVPGRRVIPLGVPIERVPGAAVRDIAALAYAGNPHKRGLEVLAAAWAAPAWTGGWSSAGSPPRPGARGWRGTACRTRASSGWA